MLFLQNSNLCCAFDEASGQPVSIKRGALSIPLSSFAFDFGCDERMANGLLEYESMLDFRTWVLPSIKPTGKPFERVPVSVTHDEKTVIVTYRCASVLVTVTYTLLETNLKVDLKLSNAGESVRYLNACAFLLTLPTVNLSFDFPANAPIGHFRADALENRKPVETGLISFAARAALRDGDLDLVFIDEIEKWGCGVYRDGENTVFVYDAGLEADLKPYETLSVGSLFLLPVEQGKNPYLAVRDLVSSLGFDPATGGITDGVMYSCHPSGTMDAHFPLKDDLFQYAEYLPKLRAMGIDHVWLLPVFAHDEHGVYHSTDQSVIDPRYGGEEGCVYYCKQAHDLGMTILFDYVPHGPAPDFPIAKEHPDWPSKRRDGTLQDEWECVSMDYNHPGYREYTAALVQDHVERFGVDGARIDCAMGGLSNWRPYADNRPSGNSVLAGVHITEAIREGFLRGGKRSFILPENFNPLPNYYHCTDLFYSMNLYRAFVELQDLLHSSPAVFVEGLTDYLEREAWLTPENYHKMRFLGNHDTVSWVWQAKRAVDCYGTDGAKALFAMISLIDGVPMLYQGDEDPTICGGNGENLTAFFTELFHARKRFLPRGSNVTEYLHTATPVMAFKRVYRDVPKDNYQTEGDGDVWVLINFSDAAQPVPESVNGALLFDNGGAEAANAPLAPWTCRILRCEG
ncbi:MAG: hypothetical protein IJK88_04890 [Clostridia bacterium]|nr:hypothetical protein [Clostridia bacterium]